MSFKDKAREVYDRGVETRGDYTPSGLPLRNYQYFVANGGDVPARENFCHYWRVALLWAPTMMWDNKYSERSKIAQGVIAYSIITALLGALWLPLAFVLIGIPTIISAGWVLAQSFPFIGKAVNRVPSKVWAFLGNTVMVLTALATLTLLAVALTQAVMSVGIWAVLGVAGIAIAAVALLFGIVACVIGFGEYVNGRRKTKKVEAQCASFAFYDEHGYWPASAVKKKSTIKAFFSGIADFAILLGQIVRVNKWKICPLVDVPKEKINA